VDMKSSRSLFQLAVSMPRTEETESGLLRGGGGDVADSKDTKRRARQLGETLATIGTPGNNKSLGCCSGRPQLAESISRQGCQRQ
jgi:hypothetical protein